MFFSKRELREDIKAKRDALDKASLHKLSDDIAINLYDTSFWKHNEWINCYISFASEVDTRNIIQKGLNDSKKICVPRINPETDNIELYQIMDLESDVQPGKYGILEPDIKKTEKVHNQIPVLHIVPGIVFDKNGGRIGYGKGYYDRFLKTINPYSVKLALAFEMQIADKIPSYENDIPVDVIVTEKSVIYLNDYPDSSEDDFLSL